MMAILTTALEVVVHTALMLSLIFCDFTVCVHRTEFLKFDILAGWAHKEQIKHVSQTIAKLILIKLMHVRSNRRS